MPIIERDPWLYQYFEKNECPKNILIPTHDGEAWTLNPQHRWIYDKLAIAQSQGLDAAPLGVIPHQFPVFSKPIMNLEGMGKGSRLLQRAEDYEFCPGH